MSCKAVVCIEIGTAGSGMSYALTRLPEDILTEQNWPLERGNFKAKTNILITRAGKVIAFGEDALQRFLEQEDGMQQKGQELPLFFRNFKLALYGETGCVCVCV